MNTMPTACQPHVVAAEHDAYGVVESGGRGGQAAPCARPTPNHVASTEVVRTTWRYIHDYRAFLCVRHLP
jgi:hypothetical protein